MSTAIAVLAVIVLVAVAVWTIYGWADLGRKFRRTGDEMRRQDRENDVH